MPLAAGTNQFPVISQRQAKMMVLASRQMTAHEESVFPTIPIEFKRRRIFKDIMSKDKALSLNHGEMSLVGDLPPHLQVKLWEAHKAAKAKNRREGIE